MSLNHTKLLALAKECLIERGETVPTLYLEQPVGKVMAVLLSFDSDTEKSEVRRKFREMISALNIKRYWMVMEAWMVSENPKDPKMPAIKPSLRQDRQEVIMVVEFRKDLHTTAWMTPFTRSKNGIQFKKTTKMADGMDSCWNFYLEEDGFNERMDQRSEELDKAFFDKQAKDVAAAWYPEFTKIVADEGHDKAMEWLNSRLIEHLYKLKNDLAKKTFEDTSDEELKDVK